MGLLGRRGEEKSGTAVRQMWGLDLCQAAASSHSRAFVSIESVRERKENGGRETAGSGKRMIRSLLIFTFQFYFVVLKALVSIEDHLPEFLASFHHDCSTTGLSVAQADI